MSFFPPAPKAGSGVSDLIGLCGYESFDSPFRHSAKMVVLTCFLIVGHNWVIPKSAYKKAVDNNST